ncbi:FAD-binding oxidoreductase [Elioraea sp. Yellowstone]|jgi:glycine/D-amino acid oxidase-like deaminating enzyme|uniref:NAD(P)/FAD-dependent oxidoreductase n=1 Tax=Elioraea sp. Yellowstone TaxID=2592070 RepID=UPI00114E584E|nr:FAD-binding oxidoreductase [Elioraea sp. Yellowstone]TQF83167.1 FAD-binding oxidoreductase [Elioraea sp. Yellowstone]
MDRSLFHPAFKARPYWWDDIPIGENPEAELPARTDVVIVGGGLTGLNCAIELARGGAGCVVLEAEDFGFGASTRNGGGVSGGINLGKGMSGARSRDGGIDPVMRAMIGDAAESFAHIETVIAREQIDCCWERSGRFVGAFTPKHYDGLAARLDLLNAVAEAGAEMVPRARQREEIASDYYFGGMRIGRSGKLHPGLYHRGLMQAAERHGAVLVGRCPAGRVTRNGTTWTVETPRGTVAAREVMIATNGYTGDLTPDLKRRVIPLASHIIATEPLDPGLARSLIPRGRTLSDTKRVLCYYRMSPDGTRVIFGGRARFTEVGPAVSAPALHAMMLERWPQLKGVRITHAWSGNTAFTFDHLPHIGVTAKGLHYAMGCNGSGVAMLSYLGAQAGRTILGGGNRLTAFDGRDFPTRPLYTGRPWFLPAIGSWYRFRDWLDRRVA